MGLSTLLRLCGSAFVAVFVAGAVLVAGAGAEWSRPVSVSAAHDQIADLQLAAGPTGDFLSWTYSDLVPAKGIFGAPRARYAVAPAGRPFGPERPLPRSYASGPLVDLGGGHLAQLILVPAGLNRDTPEVALGSVTGRFGSPQPIRGAVVYDGRARLTGNARGELLLAWIAADAHGQHRVVWASARAAGGRFGAPEVIAGRAQAEQVSDAIGTRGDMVVAFPNKWGRMLARVRRAGRAWGPLQDLGPAAGGTENDVTPFVGQDRRIVVAWYETQLCSGGCVSPGFTRAAIQQAGQSRFGRAQLLERDQTGLEGGPSGVSLAPSVIAIGARPPMIVFLAQAAPGVPVPLTVGVVKVAYPRGLRFRAPQAISPLDQPARDVAAATGPNGAIVTWVRAEPPGYWPGAVLGAVDLAGRAFGPPGQISPSEQAFDAQPTFDPASHPPGKALGPWTVAWTSRPFGGTSTVVRVSSPLCPTPSSPPAEPLAGQPDPACLGG